MRFSFVSIVILVAALATACGSAEPPRPDAAPPHACTGTVLPCDLELNDKLCNAQLGCVAFSASCSGLPTDCSSYFSSVTCGLEAGCHWDSFSNSCTGFRSCSSQLTSSTCYGVEGCSWKPLQCEGVARSCDHFVDADSCFAQDGCFWH